MVVDNPPAWLWFDVDTAVWSALVVPFFHPCLMGGLQQILVFNLVSPLHVYTLVGLALQRWDAPGLVLGTGFLHCMESLEGMQWPM